MTPSRGHFIYAVIGLGITALFLALVAFIAAVAYRIR